MVCAPVGHTAAVEVGIASPVGEDGPVVEWAEFGVVGAPWCGAEPHIPVEAGRGGLRRQVTGAGWIGDVVDEDGLDLADVAIADDLAGQAEFLVGALLAAILINAVVMAGGADDRLAFVDGQGHGLFAIDVFAGLA